MTAAGYSKVMRLAGGLLLAVSVSGVADAQTPARPPSRSRVELTASGQWMAPMDLGNSASDLTRADGGSVRFFETENSLGPAVGGAGTITVAVSRRLAIGATGSWVYGNLRSRVFGDFENVPSVEISDGMSRFGAEAVVAWTARPEARASLFLEGGGGWMREMAGGSTLAADGTVAHVGAGVKYWWAQRPLGPPARAGFRIEGRVNVRSKGISLGGNEIGAAPAVLAGLIFRL